MTAAVAALSTSLTVVASATPAQPQQSAAAGAKISWGHCQDPELSAFSAQCAMVSVPLNYAHPGGKHIKIAVSRILHTSSAAKYQGAILVNPGGPGASGLSMATL